MTGGSSGWAAFRDGLALAVGTLTVLRVRGPRSIDASRAAVAMSIAPLAILPAGALLAAIGAGLDLIALPALVTAAAVIAASVLVTRALHVDGLADTVDGLTASYDRERALTVMRTGDVGPSGTAAVVLVLGIQMFAVADLLTRDHGWAAVALAWCCARVALPLMCVRGSPSARPVGLGATVAGAVPVVALVTVTVAAMIGMAGVGLLVDRPWWQGIAALTAGLLAVAALLLRCRSRLGGITGDVLGAGVEICSAILLAGLSAG